MTSSRAAWRPRSGAASNADGAPLFDLYVDNNLPFGDAYIVAEIERAGATEIFSFDRELSRLPGIARTEPPEEAPDAGVDDV